MLIVTCICAYLILTFFANLELIYFLLTIVIFYLSTQNFLTALSKLISLETNPDRSNIVCVHANIDIYMKYTFSKCSNGRSDSLPVI